MILSNSHTWSPRVSPLASVLLAAALASACATPSTPDQASSASSAASEPSGAAALGLPAYSPAISEDAAEDVPVSALGEVDGVEAFRVGEVTVLHKRTPATAVVVARVYLRGGSARLEEETAGLERLALNVAVEGGTKSAPKDLFQAQLDAMGSSVGAFYNRDYSGYGMQSVLEHFPETWDLMVGTILEPAMPAQELELQRQRHLADLRSLQEDPDRLVGDTAVRLLFEGHPYQHLQRGTEARVALFSRDQARAYQRAMLRPSEMVVVVVGNVPANEIVRRVAVSLARVEPGALAPKVPGDFEVDRPALRVVEKSIPTHYIFGLFTAPAPGDEDYAAMLVAVEFLRDRLFEEVRTKRNLTYAVSSGLSDRRANYGYLYVTATQPDITMPVIFDEVERLQRGDFSQEQLEESRNVFLTEHFMGLETNSSQATMLAHAEIVGGDWREHADFLARARAVDAADVQRVAQEYMRNFQFAVVGSQEAADPELFAK